MTGFDPKQLQKHAKKGKFKVRTREDSTRPTGSIERAQQDLLETRLRQTSRKERGQLALPKMYTISGKQVTLYNQALASLDIGVELDPQKTYTIDRTGFCPDLVFENEGDLSLDYLGNNFILISPEQNDSSVVNPKYSFLRRVLDETYKQFAAPLATFTKCEPIIGSISNEVIEEGVERFLKEERYKDRDTIDVFVEVDTPTKAISKFMELSEQVDAINADPAVVTDAEALADAYNLAGELKTTHKKLADLRAPETERIGYQVECFRYGDENLELFYFEADKKPTFVFFARDPKVSGEIEDCFTRAFTVLNGEDRSRLLSNLMDIGMVDYLVEFVESTRDQHTGEKSAAPSNGIMGGLKVLTGKKESELPEEWHTLNDVATVLRMSDSQQIALKVSEEYEVHGSTNDLENMRGQFVRSLPAETKSQIVFPSSPLEDRLVCDLISKSTPSEALSQYHHTQAFIQDFAQRNPDEAVEKLREVDSSITFEGQNNLLINLWLVNNHQEECKKAGISFYEIEQ